MTNITPHRFKLPAYFALAYLFLIAYASLSPFTGWREAPAPGALAFLVAAWPRYYTRFDLILNFFAYLPLGFFLGLFLIGRSRPAVAIALSAGAGFLLSFVMEFAQAYLPTRFSSNLDLLVNSAGATAGALLAAGLGRRPLIAVHLAELRRNWFLPGHRVDVGLALLSLWFFSQLDPSLPLAATFEHAQGRAGQYSLLRMLSATLNFLAVGFLLRLIARSAGYALFVAFALLAAAALIKLGVGALLLKPEAALGWLGAEVLLGIGYGGFLLVLALPARARTVTALCAVTLIAGIALLLVQSQFPAPQLALRQFNWNYGQLLNYTGLERFVAELWPFLALGYLYLVRKLSA